MKTLQKRANSTGSSGKYSWRGISKIMRNITGQEFDYDVFKLEYDSNPDFFQQIVLDFNEDGLVLNTKEAQPNNPQLQQKPQDSMADVKSTAMNAAPGMLNKEI